MKTTMWKLGSKNNVLGYQSVAATRVSLRPSSRPLLPSASHITSPSLPSRPGQPQRSQQRRLPICESSSYSVQSYNNPSSGGGRRQLSDVIDDFINLPWQKIASWVTVVLLASQLRDFLGVCCFLLIQIIIHLTSVFLLLIYYR